MGGIFAFSFATQSACSNKTFQHVQLLLAKQIIFYESMYSDFSGCKKFDFGMYI